MLMLEVLGDPFGVTAALAVCLALASLAMMVVSAARGGVRRRPAVAILLAAAAYAVLNAGLIAMMLSRNSFAMFKASYMISVGVLAPALALSLLLLVPKASRPAATPGMIGFGGWVASVSFAHLWVVAVAAASV